MLGTVFLGATLSAFMRSWNILDTHLVVCSSPVTLTLAVGFKTFNPAYLALWPAKLACGIPIMILPLAGSRLIDLFGKAEIWKRVLCSLYRHVFFDVIITGSRSGLVGLAVGVVAYVTYMLIGLYRQHSLMHNKVFNRKRKND